MIELTEVRKVFPGPQGEEVVAVDAVSFAVGEGETLCLIGTSGSGKTTTMKMINRLIEPTSGEIKIDGERVNELDPIRLRRRIGYVIQKGGLFPHMTVARNVGLLCELEGWDPARTRTRVGELLELVNLPIAEFGERFPKELSGGQRQRVGVARALALDPSTILMDEPFGALDPITREQIHAEFKQLKESVKKTMVVVTHDMAEAFELGDRIALMDHGKLIQIGDEHAFRTQPANAFVEEFLRSHLHDAGEETHVGDLVEGGAAAGQAALDGGAPAVTADVTLREALRQLIASSKTQLVVTDAEGAVLGALSADDLLRHV